jgi:ATP-dependent DNA helicase RecQ
MGATSGQGGVFSVTKIIEAQDARPVDEDLLEKLRALRRDLARKGGVPSYIVFSDAALRDMCVKLPETSETFLAVSGVGEVKQKKYGDVFTALIREHLAGREDRGSE